VGRVFYHRPCIYAERALRRAAKAEDLAIDPKVS
jgi:hypothetical protein